MSHAKVKRKFNWKARQVVNTIIDDSDTKRIKLDLEVTGNYDNSNPLVLPSQKRRTKIKPDKKTQPVKILSKKQRKTLEKVIERKKKKANREQLLESLKQVQATAEEASKLVSITDIQTKGLRRFLYEEAHPEKVIPKRDKLILEGKVKVNCVKGSGAGKAPVKRRVIDRDDPNIVGFDSSSSSESEDDSNDLEPPVVNANETNEVEVDLSEISTPTEPPAIAPPEPEKRKKKPPKLERKPAVFVDVFRRPDVQKSRLKLPILSEEQQIMESINENRIVIIAGETGSGKTTQLPQFLYESGYAATKQIAVTEPRRVAAIAMSDRVAHELNLTSREVSYLIRYEGNVTDRTKIKFMTDGVLLKEIKRDYLLPKYSVIILDEAHERSVYTDILIGYLSRIVNLRHRRNDPLKLVIMSATLRLEDFVGNKRLFKRPPPVVTVEGRQFPVTNHFSKRTNDDYLDEAFKKVVKIHTKLPEGGILVFLTGQREVNSLVSKLRKAFPFRRNGTIAPDCSGDAGASDDDDFDSNLTNKKKKNKTNRLIKIIPKFDLSSYDNSADQSDNSLSDDDDDEEEEQTHFSSYSQPIWALPLYSNLPTSSQSEVFKPPPPGSRLCVVSTNVAETSLTIPDITYVVDSGKTKAKVYDKVTGVSTDVIAWTSKASADQRSGRAGRVAPGHCYRLYSSAVFKDQFPQFGAPEIQRKPVDEIYLQMKCMNIANVQSFPFPTAPDLLQLRSAEARLTVLGAIKDGKVTELGRAIEEYPVLPRFGKMLALSHQYELLPYTVLLVAALSVQEVLLETPILETGEEELKKIRQQWTSLRRYWAGKGNSLLLGDNMVLMKAVGGAEYANCEGKLEKFCEEHGLRHKAVIEIRKLRIQLTNEINNNFPEVDLSVDPRLPPPTDVQVKLLRQLLLASAGDQIARKIPPDELKDNRDKLKYRHAYRANNMEDPVFLHPSSVLRSSAPEFVVYQEIYETDRMMMRGVTAVEPDWLPLYVPTLCNFGKPLADPEPSYDEEEGRVRCVVKVAFGPQAWELPDHETEFPDTQECYRWFARFLLEGRVFPRLEKYVPSLLSRPGIMVKSWANLQNRTEALLRALISKAARSRTVLCKVWLEEPRFLLEEYLQWLPESAHADARLSWPPV